MDFALFTLVGIAAALAHLFMPGARRLGPASALAVGIAGAWNGALLASSFVRGMMASISSGLATAGSIVGAVGSLAFLEIVTDVYLRHHPDEATRAP